MFVSFVSTRWIGRRNKSLCRLCCCNNRKYQSKTKFQVACRFSQWWKTVTSSYLTSAGENNGKLSYLLLHTVTIIWGTQHALIKYSLQYTSPEFFNFIRFLLAFLTCLPSLRSSPFAIFNPSLWFSGMELGFWLFLGFALQSLGLETTEANKSGFLLYLNVKFVPLCLWLLYGKRISLDTWSSVFLAFFGTLLLSFDIHSYYISKGDIYCILAALASSLFIIRLGNAAKQYSATLLNICSLFTVTLCCLIWLGLEHVSDLSQIQEQWKLIPKLVEQQWWCWLYLGCVTTGLGNWLQTIAQRNISPEKVRNSYNTITCPYKNYLGFDSLCSRSFIWSNLFLVVLTRNIVSSGVYWCSFYCRSSYLQCKDNLSVSVHHNDIFLF